MNAYAITITEMPSFSTVMNFDDLNLALVICVPLYAPGAGDTSFFDTDFDTETFPTSGRFRY